MRTFTFSGAVCLLMLLVASCKDEIITQKLYYGTYESHNNCNKEYVEVLTNGKYRYKFIQEDKPVFTYEDNYQLEVDNTSRKHHIYIVFNNWRNAFNPNYKTNLLANCHKAVLDKNLASQSAAAYFQLQKEHDSFWGDSKHLVIQRNPDYIQYDFKKLRDNEPEVTQALSSYRLP